MLKIDIQMTKLINQSFKLKIISIVSCSQKARVEGWKSLRLQTPAQQQCFPILALFCVYFCPLHLIGSSSALQRLDKFVFSMRCVLDKAGQRTGGWGLGICSQMETTWGTDVVKIVKNESISVLEINASSMMRRFMINVQGFIDFSPIRAVGGIVLS